MIVSPHYPVWAFRNWFGWLFYCTFDILSCNGRKTHNSMSSYFSVSVKVIFSSKYEAFWSFLRVIFIYFIYFLPVKCHCPSLTRKNKATISDLSVCICKQRLVCILYIYIYRTENGCVPHISSKIKQKQHSAAVYWCIFSCCFKRTTKLNYVYIFLDPKSLIIFALIVTCFCLWWCEMEDVPIFFTEYIRVLSQKHTRLFACRSCDYFRVKRFQNEG